MKKEFSIIEQEKREKLGVHRKKLLDNSPYLRIIANSNKIHYKIDNKSKQAFYKSNEWRDLKIYAREIYEKRCFCCGDTNNIHLDHIYPVSVAPERALSIRNVQWLCKNCNQTKSNLGNHRFPRLRIENAVLDKEKLKELEQKWATFFPLVTKKPNYATKDQIRSLLKRKVKLYSLPTASDASKMLRGLKLLEKIKPKTNKAAHTPPYCGKVKTILRKKTQD